MDRRYVNWLASGIVTFTLAFAGSKRILKAALRLKGTVTSVEPASITSHWKLKGQRA